METTEDVNPYLNRGKKEKLTNFLGGFAKKDDIPVDAPPKKLIKEPSDKSNSSGWGGSMMNKLFGKFF